MTTFRCFWVEGKFQHAAVLTQSIHTPREIHSVNTLYNIREYLWWLWWVDKLLSYRKIAETAYVPRFNVDGPVEQQPFLALS